MCWLLPERIRRRKRRRCRGLALLRLRRAYKKSRNTEYVYILVLRKEITSGTDDVLRAIISVSCRGHCHWTILSAVRRCCSSNAAPCDLYNTPPMLDTEYMPPSDSIYVQGLLSSTSICVAVAASLIPSMHSLQLLHQFTYSLQPSLFLSDLSESLHNAFLLLSRQVQKLFNHLAVHKAVRL